MQSVCIRQLALAQGKAQSCTPTVGCAATGLGSTKAAFNGKRQVLAAMQHPRARRALTCGAAAPQLTTAVAAPLANAVGGFAARALGSGVLLNLVRSARGALSGRAGPVVVAGLVAYSVAMTVYANRARSTAVSAASSAGVSTLEPEAPTAADSMAAATTTGLRYPLPVPLPQPELEKKLEQLRASASAATKDGRVVCKVCGGSGKVFYENHMMSYDGTTCPCCLGKGSVKSNKGDLISCLLSFDP